MKKRSHRVVSALLFASLPVACATGGPPTAGAPAGAPQSAGAAASAAAQSVAAAPGPQGELDQALPFDKRVRTGKLPNGLTYFILPHKKPEKRAQLWLAVNAGSVLEDDDQRGLAHFVEHMGFNGTKRFPKQDLVDFLETSGVKFGADLNAYTSFDETVYMLQVPTDKPELVDKGIKVLRDWAGDISFAPDELEKERGVVLEEWRLGRGAGRRIWDKQTKVIYHGSKYAERTPIGEAEIIKKAPREAFLRFYRDWYRPDLMAVVAVGDFSPDEIEKQIATEFGDLKNPSSPRPRPTVPVPPHKDVLVSIETDPELPTTRVSVLGKMPHRPERTVRDFRRQAAERLYQSMLNARLDEIRRRPDAPFVSADVGTREVVRALDVFSPSATVKGDDVEKALTALLEEVERVERHGFQASELDRAKRSMVRQYQQSLAQRDKRDARSFADELVDHFLTGEEVPGVEVELALVEKLLPTITLAELNGLAKTWGGDENRVITVSGPDKLKRPTPEALLSVARSVAARPLTPYEDGVSDKSLVAKPPTPGKVVSERTVPEVGLIEWKLANGARVVLKSTDFNDDEVRLSAFSPGGHSLVPDADFDTARFADTVVGEGGVGAFSAVDLRKTLSGKVAYVGANVGELEESLIGSASPKDLELLFQLVHLRFTAPRKDAQAFEAWRSRQIESVRNRRLSPEAVFGEDLMSFAYQNHPRRKPVTPEVVSKVDLDKAMRIYADRFADAGDFTFVFVGNFDTAQMKPLVETYLGSLPASGRKETWRDLKVRPPKGVQTKTVVAGREPKSQVVMIFHGKEKWTRDADNDMRLLAEVLRMRLRERLREDMGGVYGVGAGGGISRRPAPLYAFSIQFGCAPENVEKLKEAVLAEIKAIQKDGIADSYLEKVKASRRRGHEVNLKENRFWEGELRRAYTFGDDPREILDVEKEIAKISSDRLRAAARKYLRPREIVVGVLKPDLAAGPAQPKPDAAPQGPPSPGPKAPTSAGPAPARPAASLAPAAAPR